MTNKGKRAPLEIFAVSPDMTSCQFNKSLLIYLDRHRVWCWDVKMDFAFNSICVHLLIPSYNKYTSSTTLCWKTDIQTWGCTTPPVRVLRRNRCVRIQWCECHVKFRGEVVTDRTGDRGVGVGKEGLPDTELWEHGSSLWEWDLFKEYLSSV